jgi:hypothetical protein
MRSMQDTWPRYARKELGARSTKAQATSNSSATAAVTQAAAVSATASTAAAPSSHSSHATGAELSSAQGSVYRVLLDMGFQRPVGMHMASSCVVRVVLVSVCVRSVRSSDDSGHTRRCAGRSARSVGERRGSRRERAAQVASAAERACARRRREQADGAVQDVRYRRVARLPRHARSVREDAHSHTTRARERGSRLYVRAVTHVRAVRAVRRAARVRCWHAQAVRVQSHTVHVGVSTGAKCCHSAM